MAKKASVSKIDKTVEVKASDICSVAKSYQLPIDKEALGSMPDYIKSVKGLSAVDMQQELFARCDIIKACVRDASLNFLRIGQTLKSIRADFNFAKSEYKSFELFCKCLFDMSRTSAFNYIKVYELFADRLRLEENFRHFTFSQLVELVPIAGKIEEFKITPATSIEYIRAVKKSDKNKDVEMVAQVADKEAVVSVKHFVFESIVDIKAFLSDYANWPHLGSVEALDINFYRVYLSDGRELVAESLGSRVEFHFIYTASGYDFIGRSLENIAKAIFDYGYSASTEPIQDVGAENTAVAS